MTALEDLPESRMGGSFDWVNPNYDPIWQKRNSHLAKLRENPQLLEASKVWYRKHPWSFIDDWGLTFDPRNSSRGLPVKMPFILFPRQVEFVEWMYWMWKEQKRGLVEKSRDCGATWLAVGFSTTMWLFEPGFVCGFGSRKEELVDKRGDDRAIFERIRFFMDALPIEFMPAGYDERTWRGHMRVTNLLNGSALIGEAGDNIGRGGRTAAYIVDEAAHIDHQDSVDVSLSGNTNCQIDMSSVNTSGNAFYRKRMRLDKRPELFVFDWRAQPLDAKILTPTGYRLMGEIRQGDAVIGADGKAVGVVGVFPQGRKEIFRVSFNDGSSTECCAEHLWSVTTYGDQRAERQDIRHVMQLKEMMADYAEVDARGFNWHNYQIPLAAPISAFESVDLPIDPYVLGCLIGDGHFPKDDAQAIYLTVGDDDRELVALVAERLPIGCSMKPVSGIQYRVAADARYRGGEGRGYHNPIKAAIRLLGLESHKSYEKFIPETYQRGSIESRLELLRGLMDADGCVLKSSPGSAALSTTSRRLADDVIALAQTLGGTAKLWTIPARVGVEMPGGRLSDTREGYRVDVRLPAKMVPFKLSRKALAYQPATRRPPRRSMVDIKLIGEKECQCIKVSSEDGLYLTDGCIVTHNSDPRKNAAWHQKKLEEFQGREWMFAQEYSRDYNAAQEASFIQGAWVQAAIDAHLKLGFDPNGIRVTGFDPADVGDAKAIVNRWGSVITDAQLCPIGDITLAIPWAYNEADRARSDVLRFDADGMGAPAMKLAFQGRSAGRMAITPYNGSGKVEDPAMVYGFVVTPENAAEHRDDRTNEDMFLNYRAQTWTWLADRFKKTYDAIQRAGKGHAVNVSFEDLISIDSHCKDLHQLTAELSRPKRVFTKNGRIQVESKVDMRARQVDSPNLADAAVMAFATRKKVVEKRILVPRRQMMDRGVGW